MHTCLHLKCCTRAKHLYTLPAAGLSSSLSRAKEVRGHVFLFKGLYSQPNKPRLFPIACHHHDHVKK